MQGLGTSCRIYYTDYYLESIYKGRISLFFLLLLLLL
jgi:hypothetical protein